MQTLEHEKFLSLRTGAEVVEADHFGEKVLRLADGTYLKLFRRKRLISSAAWYPYAQRFADNARALAALGIPCPEVIDVYRLPEIARDGVHYRPLEGRTLRQLIAADAAGADLRRAFGSFVAGLHDLGVYFRSLHLGNVVLGGDTALGLIDIADLTIGRKPLSWRLRERNMKHLLRAASDRAWLTDDAMEAFSAGYVAHSGHPLPAFGIDRQSPPRQRP